jgi:exosortase/archaeosortase
MAAATAKPGLTIRALLALLPVRFDDARFWPRAVAGLALRWGALELEWWWLRDAVTAAVASLLGAAGLPTAMSDRAALALASGGATFHVTVSCTHVEVLALLGPLVVDRTAGLLRTARDLAWLAGALASFAVLRIALAIGLYSAGVSWLWAHDVVLGLGYFAFMAAVLKRGAWARPRV